MPARPGDDIVEGARVIWKPVHKQHGPVCLGAAVLVDNLQRLGGDPFDTRGSDRGGFTLNSYWLLRPHHHRPRRRAPKTRDELPPPHPSSPWPRERQSTLDAVEGEPGWSETPRTHRRNENTSKSVNAFVNALHKGIEGRSMLYREPSRWMSPNGQIVTQLRWVVK